MILNILIERETKVIKIMNYNQTHYNINWIQGDFKHNINCIQRVYSWTCNRQFKVYNET